MQNHTPVTPETPEVELVVRNGQRKEVILGSKADALTRRQAMFVKGYVESDGDPLMGMRAIGYRGSEARHEGLRMLRDINVAREVYYQTQTVLMGDALKARSVLRAILDSPTAAHKDKIAAAKTMLDRGGFPAMATARPVEDEDKEPSAMSADQLEAVVVAMRRQLAAHDAEFEEVPVDAPPLASPAYEAGTLNPAVETPVTQEPAPAAEPSLDEQLSAVLDGQFTVTPPPVAAMGSASAVPFPTFAGGLPIYQP